MNHDAHDSWNELKKKLSSKIAFAHCKTREVWWCSIGMIVGTELFGKNELFERPVLVLKIYNQETIFVIPLTSKVKEGRYFEALDCDGVTRYAILSQARTVSNKRLSRKIGKISQEYFLRIKARFVEAL